MKFKPNSCHYVKLLNSKNVNTSNLRYNFYIIRGYEYLPGAFALSPASKLSPNKDDFRYLRRPKNNSKEQPGCRLAGWDEIHNSGGGDGGQQQQCACAPTVHQPRHSTKGRSKHRFQKEEFGRVFYAADPVFIDPFYGADESIPSPGRPVRQPYLTPGYIGWRNWSFGIRSWAP